jgi:hypothetical protein
MCSAKIRSFGTCAEKTIKTRKRKTKFGDTSLHCCSWVKVRVVSVTIFFYRILNTTACKCNHSICNAKRTCMVKRRFTGTQNSAEYTTATSTVLLHAIKCVLLFYAKRGHEIAKSRMKSIRNAYTNWKKSMRKRSNMPSGSSGTERKMSAYKYAAELAFLDPVITSAQTFDNLSQVCLAFNYVIVNSQI